MITSLVIKNASDGFSGSVALDTNIYPLSKFDWHPETDGADISKQVHYGRWPAYKFTRNMPIIMEGRILATTDTTDYWTKRKALIAKATVDPANTTYDPIKFELVVDGDGNTYYAYCVLDTWSAPLDTNLESPLISEFQGQYSCRFGYWRKASDNSAVANL